MDSDDDQDFQIDLRAKRRHRQQNLQSAREQGDKHKAILIDDFPIASRRTSSSVKASLRHTVSSQPSEPKYCTRL